MKSLKPSKARAFGSRVRKIRRAREMSQEALALGVGIKQGHVSMIETGKRGLSQDTAERIAKFLGIDLPSLTGKRS